jgi:pentatricopeptide repeat protein
VLIKIYPPWEKKIHKHIIDNNYPQSIALKNNIIYMYGKIGCPEEAFNVFSKIKTYERDIITWNSIIQAFGDNRNGKEALQLFEQMLRQGLKPNDQTITCVLKACCDSGLIRNAVKIFFALKTAFHIEPNNYHYNCLLTACADNAMLEMGRKIHQYIIDNNYPQDIVLKSNLIHMYGKCKKLDEAVRIFNNIRMSERDVIAWTSMISVYVDNEKKEEALELFKQMQEEGAKPNEQTIACILKACCDSDLIYSAVDILFSMERKLQIKPDEYHYNYLLSACGERGLLSLGTMIHNHIEQINFPQSIILKNNLINMYGKCGNLEEAIKIFNSIRIPESSVPVWNSIISACGYHGRGKESLKLFEKMQKEGFQPDELTITCVLNACSHSGLVQEALDIFYKLESKFKIKPNIVHCSCIVDILCKAGQLEEAEAFITDYMKKQQIEPNTITWSTLLSASKAQMDSKRVTRIAQIIKALKRKDVATSRK